MIINPKKRNKKILIIGGNGFIGSHLVEKLKKMNYQVSIFDRSKNRFMGEIEGIEYSYGSLENIHKFKKLFSNVDVLYHLINTTVPLTADKNPEYDVRSNIMGTLKLLNIAVKAKVKRIVFSSSGGTVYGDAKDSPVNEKHPLDPKGSYGIVKTAIENYIKMFAKKFDFSWLIVRPANAYGPRQNYQGKQGVISTFLFNALQGKSLYIWGNSKSVRDYIYISDVVEFFVKAGLSEKTGVYNIGSGRGVSLNKIIKLIKKITGRKVEIRRINNKTFNVNKVVLDITRAKKEFGWKPTISLEEGIELHYKWMKNVLINL